MTMLKYWDAVSAAWVPIGGMSGEKAVLPVAGGKMSGPLRVTGDLTTTGVVHADFYSNPNLDAYLDPSIELRKRSVRFGGNTVDNTASPVAAGDLATNGYLSTTSSTGLERAVLTLTAGWQSYPVATYGSPTAYQSADGMVTLHGTLLALTAFTPSSSSTPITTLPVGMRPSLWKLVPVAGRDCAYRCEVRSDGKVVLTAGSVAIAVNSWVTLNDICFYPV